MDKENLDAAIPPSVWPTATTGSQKYATSENQASLVSMVLILDGNSDTGAHAAPQEHFLVFDLFQVFHWIESSHNSDLFLLNRLFSIMSRNRMQLIRIRTFKKTPGFLLV